MTDALGQVLPIRPKAISVGELNRQAKSKLEEGFGQLWVEGEVAQLKIAASGHAYFDLKDPKEDARISCCFFKGPMSKAGVVLREGSSIAIRGKPSLYTPRGQFQFTVETAYLAGAGSAAAALEALKRKLAGEGLLGLDRKRAIPTYPRAVGVVTARAGAAFADICRVLTRRWPVRVVLANTLVQGTDAPQQIVQALLRIQQVPEVDVVIVGRGGGASEDLAAFNDERVARAIAACKIPVISAVGHEVDHTIADLVADLRAATPSNAAELAVPERSAVLEDITTKAKRLHKAAHSLLNRKRVTLQRLDKRLGDPRKITNAARQRLDDIVTRMAGIVRSRTKRAVMVFGRADKRLQNAHPRLQVGHKRAQLAQLSQRLKPAMQQWLEARRRLVAQQQEALAPAVTVVLSAQRAQAAKLAAQLHALSPLAILARGYSVTLSAQGKALTDASAVTIGDKLTVRLQRGLLGVTVEHASSETDAEPTGHDSDK
jgi:exodeoxyribonuclease VII large subunit